MERICAAAWITAIALSWSAIGAVHASGNPIAGAESLAAGRMLYLQGTRTDGAPLEARRAGGLTLSGAEAACANCHRRSGFGGAEGRSYIPPVDAASLFEAKRPGTGASASGIGRPAYDERTLARAIREGIDPAGRRLDYMMPRYDLTDAEMGSLYAYVRQLSIRPYANGEADVLDFATVLAPGGDPARGRAMSDVLQACFAEHNAGSDPAPGRKRLSPAMSLRSQPNWKLHVWELQGRPETWEAQLAAYARRTPVFAVIGGVGGGDWAPIHDYCERDGLPCLFPSVEVPVADKTGYYSLYLSRGLLLEAALIAGDVAEHSDDVRRVVQVMRIGDEAAHAAAQALQRHLGAKGISTEQRQLAAAAPLDERTFDLAPNDALVLWLRTGDIRQLQTIPAVAVPVYLSATLARGERAPLPAAWKAGTLIAYPYELPQNRELRTAQLRTWLQARGLSLTDEAVQTDAYIACRALGAGMNETSNHLHRDYLVERVETATGRGTYVGHYPNLSLGAGQRFASKSGYLVRFTGPEYAVMTPLGERTAP